MQGIADAADVSAVAQRQQRKQRLQQVFNRVERTHMMEVVSFQFPLEGSIQFELESDGLEMLRRYVERMFADDDLVDGVNLLVADYLRRHLQAAKLGQEAGHGSRFCFGEDLGLFVRFYPRVEWLVHFPRQDLSLRSIPTFDEKLATAMQVDGPGRNIRSRSGLR